MSSITAAGLLRSGGFISRLKGGLAALALLVLAAPAHAAITARVTYQTHAAYLARGNPAPGELMFMRSNSAPSGGMYDEIANNNNARLTLSGNVTNATVNLGSTAGYFTANYNNANSMGATGCVTTPIDFTTYQHLNDGDVIDITITCTPPPPTLSNISPSSGPPGGGTAVTLTGNYLAGATSVTFGGTAATITANDASSITATAPAHAAGNVSVVVTTANGSAALSYTYTAPAPTVTAANISLSGASGTGGAYKSGDTVTATWNNTASGDNNSGVTGVTVDFSQFGSGANVAASNSGGNWSASYTITAGSIEMPNRNVSVAATTAGGTTTLTGANNVTVDNKASTVTSVTSGAANGTYKIGNAISIFVSFHEPVTVTGTPQLTLETGSTDRTVNYATMAGGSTLAFIYTVQAGDSSADLDYLSTTALALSGSTIQDAVGNYATLTLPTPGAADSLGANKSIVIDGVAPTVSSIVVDGSPANSATSIAFTVSFSEPVANVSTDDFTLVGTGTASGTIASVSGSGSVYSVTVNSITGNGTLKLNLNGSTDIVDNAGNNTPSYSSGSTHTVAFAAPLLTGATPTAGPVAGGTSVTLTGSNLTGATSVTFGGTAGTGLTVNSATSLTVTAPAHAAGTVSVVVTTPGGTATLTNGYTYVAAPTITSVSPASGPSAGNAILTINGSNLGNATVTIGGISVSIFDTDGSSWIRVVTPMHAVGAVSVVVTTSGGAATLVGGYTYLPAPTITSISPAVGPVAGGAAVTITGTNFDPTAGNNIVLFNSITATVTAATATSLTVTTPANSPGPVNVAVNAPGGSVTAFNSYTYANAPNAPTGVTATAGDTQASVTFTAPNANGSAITGYTVTASPGGLTGTGATSPIVVTGLLNGTPYTFTVTATNAMGDSAASAASNSATPKAAQTITFTNPGSQNYGTTPTLTATASSGQPVTFTSATTGVCTITSGGALTFTSAGSCTINADQAGNGTYQAAPQVSQTFTVNAVVAGAPSSVVATAGDTQASVAFTAPASSGGATITNYTVTTNPGGLTASGGSSPIVVTGLINGTAYTFTVTADNSGGTGAASGASNSVTPSAPQTITFTNPGSQAFGTTPALTATASSGLTVAFTSATAGVCTITSGGALTFLTSGTCTIDADQAGNGSYLAAPGVSQSFTVNAVVAGAPTIGTATAGDTQASVTFAPPASNGGSAITGYTVTSNPGGLTASGGSSPITVTGLTNGTAYTFTVTATNSAGTGAASGASNSVTPKAPQTITFNNPSSQNYGTTPTLTATATSGLTVAFTSATAGVCTVTSGGALTFLTTGSCTINANQAGDGSWLAAPQVQQTFAVNAATPGAPTIGTATVTGAGQVTVAFTAPAFNGGAAITGYTVTSNPGGITASGAASPIVVAGLQPGTAYTFTVVATNSAGNSTPSGASNSVTPVPALVAGAVTATVNYAATGVALPLNITGTANAVTVVTAPAHGTATASGTGITYTAAAGYAGPDSFTYSASDAYSTSPAATVTITVNAPALVLGPASLPAAIASNAYSQSMVTTGGAAPYSYATSGLPAGLSLSANGELSGTPTAAGSFSFDVTTTDSSTGIGPFSVTRHYTLQIDAPSLQLDSELPPATGDTDYHQPLTAHGGTAPYRFALFAGALPPGLTLAESGQIDGEPTAAGSYDFTVQVTDANGFTGVQTYRFVVQAAGQAINAFVATPAAPVYAQGGTFSVSASGGASGNPVSFASTTPTVCTVASTRVTMLAAGTCVLTADQAGNAMYQAAAQVRLEVNIATGTPQLSWLADLAKVDGEAAFELPEPQSNSPGAFSYSSSNPAVATVSGRTVTLIGSGTTVLLASQAATNGYAAATVQVQLTVREGLNNSAKLRDNVASLRR